MKLLCDLGNTRIKWAWTDGTALTGFGSGDYAGTDDYAARLPAFPVPEAIVAISVARHHNEAFTRLCEQRWERAPRWRESAREGFGVESLYEPPESLGADRFAALVGARARYPGQSVCVADCGTAITVDALDAEGVFQGGVILPGLSAAAGALQGIAAGLAAPGEHRIYAAYGRNTRDAIGAGLVIGAAGAVERIFRDQGAVLGPGALLVVTGGDAARIGAYLTCPYEHQTHLTLEGLAVMAA